MFVHPISLSILPDGEHFRVQVSYEIESNQWDIASQQLYSHRCTIEQASLGGGPFARPIRVNLPVEDDVLTGRPERYIVHIDEIVGRSQLAGVSDANFAAFDADSVRAWVYVFPPAVSNPVTIAGLERSPGLGGATAA